MNVEFEGLNREGDPIVYVREVDRDDLPEAIQAKLEPAQKLYAVHSAEGERLALVADRDLAFALARQNDFSPVAVH